MVSDDFDARITSKAKSKGRLIGLVHWPISRTDDSRNDEQVSLSNWTTKQKFDNIIIISDARLTITP